jgi:hypothetical protein
MRYNVTIDVLGVRYTTVVDTQRGPNELLTALENLNDKPTLSSVEYHVGLFG